MIGRKNIFFIAFIAMPLLSLIGCEPASVITKKNQLADFKKIKKIAVLPFSSSSPDLGINVADSVGTELLGMNFDLVERTQIEGILREQHFEYTGAVTPETAKAIGRLASVDAILTGSVVPFALSDYVWGGGTGGISSANVRLIDTETGLIIFSTNYKNGEINATYQRFNKSISVIVNSIENTISK